ncbi:MAG: orotidine-5'-phosphate decarboxylase, partial [Candidatus Diapherotrites archaeon]|nr:orotidine-5'-phosphate decarboxylase [Candidatus Diapherotrites archaeon]
MSFAQRLEKRFSATGNCACLGLDPVLERIPEKKESVSKTLSNFLISILSECESQGCLPNCVKPNIAFYSQYGVEGLLALQDVLLVCREMKMLVVFDGKRGDIGRTSQAYAQEAFGVWKADAATVAPYMGFDSVKPFAEAARERECGVLVLCRTSNPTASEFQDLRLENGSKVFEQVTKTISEWNALAPGTIGAVVGATQPQELESVAAYFSSQQHPTTLLIPGVILVLYFIPGKVETPVEVETPV